ncbi:CGNR zinc finger domain-containing protein [Kribbella sindirgiensis]|uniref:4-hydroxybenzoyl-CoA reductase n=1 Tax=Kribbella sindirgiensis TaxID=1124744 RepID=A0A4R0I7B2_9ACTN|nr:ABATE domain-containing protein [Kribbella sindirgiensis]TCC28783.1 4-hydroxybenzoyl-CoA reductase [Kribbella sindirgiensis]
METRFTWVGGRPSVDFTATLGKRQQTPFERIPEPADLGRWFREAGLAQDEPVVSGRAYRQAVELREALYRLFTGATDAADLEVVNRWSSRPSAGPRLTSELRAEYVAVDVLGLLSSLARDAVDLLTGPLADRIRTCAADDCSLLYVDASRAGRRRWCSMNTCGARAKMATYRAVD